LFKIKLFKVSSWSLQGHFMTLQHNFDFNYEV